MRVLVVTQGEYGKRMLQNLQGHAPATWTVTEWQAPANLPMVMDYPEDYLPKSLPAADLALALGENPALAELIPEVVRLSGACSVIAPMDRPEWLPMGLARQLAGWLRDIGVSAVFPKPLCSLTETSYNVRRYLVEYHDELIAEFARHFGRPCFSITVGADGKTIVSAEAERDAVCGCARYIAQGLTGVSVDEAEFQAGMLHHHYPCLAAMGMDNDFSDTLMHVSGNIAKEEVKQRLTPYVTVQYFMPQGRVDAPEAPDPSKTQDVDPARR